MNGKIIFLPPSLGPPPGVPPLSGLLSGHGPRSLLGDLKAGRGTEDIIIADVGSVVGLLDAVDTNATVAVAAPSSSSSPSSRFVG